LANERKIEVTWFLQGIGIKGREMALVWHEKAGRAANAHSFGTDIQHDYSQGNFRTMSSSLFYYSIC